jgi:deoxycytidylate deaminase
MAFDEAKIRELLLEALSKPCCKKHPVAAVIETRSGEYIIGWNGPPVPDEKHECLRKGYASGTGMELCPSLHAERRAISYAARHGTITLDSVIYLNEWFPCADCAKSIITAGMAKVVTPDQVYSNKATHELALYLRNQPYNFELAERLIRDADIEIIVAPGIKVSKKA